MDQLPGILVTLPRGQVRSLELWKLELVAERELVPGAKYGIRNSRKRIAERMIVVERELVHGLRVIAERLIVVTKRKRRRQRIVRRLLRLGSGGAAAA